MYAISQNYLDYINNDNNIGRTVKNKLVIDDTEYFSDSLKTNPKVSYEATSFIGGFYSGSCEFEILNLDGSLVLNNKEVTIYKGLEFNGATEWVPMGIFKATDPNIESNESTKSIKFKGYDRAVLFDTPYNTNLDWNNAHTGLEIVQEVCNNVGIILETTDFAFASYSFTSKPNFLEDTLNREVIGRMGEIGGEIAFISRIGGLRIEGQYNTNKNLFDINKAVAGYLSDNNGNIAVSSTIMNEKTSDYIYVYEKGNITLSISVTIPSGSDNYVWFGALFYDENKNPIGNRTSEHNVANNILTIAVPNDAYYVRVSARFYSDGILQVEYGTEATSYQPYMPPIGKRKRISLTKEPLYGPINTVALGKANIEDDVIYPETITGDRITWRIEDNPYVDLIREEIIEDVASHIIGMSITPFTINGFIDDFIYDLNDVISVYDNDGNTFDAVMLNYATENRMRSNVGAEAQTEKTINHEIAGSTKQQLNRVSIKVDHNTQQIELLATNVDELNESTTQILQTAENIIMTALQDYVTTNDFETFQTTVSTQFQQTAEDFNFIFSNITQQLNDLDANTQEQFQEITKYIRFVNGNIVLGEVGNELTLNIANDRISFLQNDSEVAYFSNNKLYVTDGEFLNSLIIGNFAWKPRANGNLSLVYIGGDN